MTATFHAKKIVGDFDVFKGHRTMADLVCLDDPFAILHGWVSHLGAKRSRFFRTLDLSLTETFLVHPLRGSDAFLEFLDHLESSFLLEVQSFFFVDGIGDI